MRYRAIFRSRNQIVDILEAPINLEDFRERYYLADVSTKREQLEREHGCSVSVEVEVMPKPISSAIQSS